MKQFIKEKLSKHLNEFYDVDFEYPEVNFDIGRKKTSVDDNFKTLISQLRAKKVNGKRNTYAFRNDNSIIYFKPNGKNAIELDLIETDPQFRGNGSAKTTMRSFLSIVDKNKIQVYLSIVPRDKETTIKGLENFYTSFGFNKTSDFEMVRNAKINESFGSTSKLPQKVDINPDVLNILKSLTWKDIQLESGGDDGHSKIDMSIQFSNPSLNDVTNGIVFYIQLIKNNFYHPHLFMSQSLQGIGLGAKLLKAFIMDFGHIYVTDARIVNDDFKKMVNKLLTDPDFEVAKGKLGLMVIKKGNPDAKKLIRYVND